MILVYDGYINTFDAIVLGYAGSYSGIEVISEWFIDLESPNIPSIDLESPSISPIDLESPNIPSIDLESQNSS